MSAFSSFTTRSAFAGILLLLGATCFGGLPASAATGAPALPAGSAVAGSLQVLTPARLLDTRPAPVAAGSTTAAQMAGRGGVPAHVAAVQLTLTVAGSTAAGYLTVFADGAHRPGTSNLNFSPGRAVANTVTVPVGADGKVAIYNGSPGATGLIVDVTGYYPAGAPTAAGALNLITSSRVLDTRPSPVAAGATIAAKVTGRGGVPVVVAAVQVTVTVAGSSRPGYLTVYADRATRPGTSNLNFTAGEDVANTVTVPVGADGRLAIYNGSPGTTGLILDVTGYYTAGTPTAAGTLNVVTATRVLDTRPTPDPGHGVTTVAVDGRGGIPAGVAAVQVTVTAAGSTAPGYLTVYPSGAARPGTSNVNFGRGQNVANTVTVPVGADGKIAVYNGSAGATDLIVDVTGYYTAGIPGAASNVVGWVPSGTPDTTTYGTTSIITGLRRGITAISGRHALAVDGTVWLLALPGSTAPPQQILGLDHIVALAQAECSYALKSDGTVWAWGENLDGSLGIGNNTRTNQVVQVSGLTGITAIAGGGSHGYALDSQGAVWRWGQDVFGIGNGNDFGQYGYLPQRIPGLTGVVGIGGNDEDGYAITADGNLLAWGFGLDGQLGDDQTDHNSDAPVQVHGLSHVVAIADQGRITAYALTADGQVWAWGEGGEGQLGNGTRQLTTATPVKVSGVDNAIAISGNYALTSTGTVLAWGVRNQAPLPDGTIRQRYVDAPVPVAHLTAAYAIAAGGPEGWALTR